MSTCKQDVAGIEFNEPESRRLACILAARSLHGSRKILYRVMTQAQTRLILTLNLTPYLGTPYLGISSSHAVSVASEILALLKMLKEPELDQIAEDAAAAKRTGSRRPSCKPRCQ